MTQLRQKDSDISSHSHQSLSEKKGKNEEHHESADSLGAKRSVTSSKSKPLSELEERIRNGRDFDKKAGLESDKNGSCKEDVFVVVVVEDEDSEAERASALKDEEISKGESKWKDELENNIPLHDAIFCGYNASEDEKSRLKSAHVEDTELP
eukprot:1707194-Ditylum_brightwellii.AAC.1